jgi:MtN3 and saliva related transmembrane protein
MVAAPLLTQIVGSGAAVASMSSFVPQLLKIIREKTGESVSSPMYVLTVTAFSLWCAYGVMLSSWPLVVSNAISLALSSAILALNLRYRSRSEDPAR